MELKDMAPMIEQMKTNIASIEAKAEAQGQTGAEALALAKEAKEKLAAIEAKSGITPDELKAALKEHGTEFQAQFDQLATKMGKPTSNEEAKTLKSAIMDGVKDYFPEYNPNPLGVGASIVEQPQGKLLKMFANDKQAKLRIPLFANTILPTDIEEKTMTLSGNLTGPAFATQDPRMAIFPSQKINAREILPTFQTETGYYVYWKEDTGESNNIAFQVEGSIKAENSYSLTGTAVAESFLAGFTTFSKQMVNSLPFLTQYLPQMLMRDFYKKENAYAYSVMATGTGSTSITSTTDNVEKIIYYIANQLAGNYNASFAIVSPADYAKLVISTYTKGYYPGAGTVMYNGTSLTLDGVPIIRATWATTGRVIIIDRDFIQRVQVSGLAIELSYENDQNFTKNLVTARIECQEEFVLQLLPSAIYGTLA